MHMNDNNAENCRNTERPVFFKIVYHHGYSMNPFFPTFSLEFEMFKRWQFHTKIQVRSKIIVKMSMFQMKHFPWFFFGH